MRNHFKKSPASSEADTLEEGDLEDISDAESTGETKEQQMKKGSQVRHRQAISHVFCIERLLRQKFSSEELGELNDSLKRFGNKQTILEQMQVGMEADGEILKFRKGLEILQERKETFFGKYFDMKPLLNILGEECNARGATCLLCTTAKPPADPILSDTVS